MSLLLEDDSIKSMIIFSVMAIFIIIIIKSLFKNFPDEEDEFEDDAEDDNVVENVGKREKGRGDSKEPPFIYYKDFLKDWIIDKSKKLGYRYESKPGVYVILIFERKVKRNKFSHYRDVYVGQSVKMASRVHNHLIGKGNGDVYADVKYGKYVYVQLNYCNYGDMNSLEKNLIKKYNAMKSYNNTKGGGIERVNPD